MKLEGTSKLSAKTQNFDNIFAVFRKYYLWLLNVKSFGQPVRIYIGLKFGIQIVKFNFNRCNMYSNASSFLIITQKLVDKRTVILDSHT